MPYLEFDAQKLPFVFVGNGVWNPWGGWLPCAVSCGGALQKRYRTCYFPDPDNPGDHCRIDGSDPVESRPCNTFSCPSKQNGNIR